MLGRNEHYIDGKWVAPLEMGDPIEVINPATELVIGVGARGSAEDVDRAVAAARSAFPGYSQTTTEERVALLTRIMEIYMSRADEIAKVISSEMGSPISFSYNVQTLAPIEQFRVAIETLKGFRMQCAVGGYEVVHEPVGVCGLITAWNWPLVLVAAKTAYSLAAGCTVVLKPSEMSPLSAIMFTEILHDAGVPPGVFNVVFGDGPTVGNAIAAHPDIDMISFTGSTRAGIHVAQTAAVTVKRVHQELGGKSVNIVLPDADLSTAISANIRRLFANAGQSCQSPTRLLVDKDRYEEALEHARIVAESIICGDPSHPDTVLGPVVSAAQYDRVQGLIKAGIDEGARLVTGGLGRVQGMGRGYFVRPTIFGDVSNSMTIARTEIFGPVLPILSYSDIDEAVEIANDTPYGLANYIQSADPKAARSLAGRLRSGRVYINTMNQNSRAPFGGYKQSGNGREQGDLGLSEYLEVKALIYE
ncbi:aldehyde dehydrogenase family protein [Pusillimonas noertemannii]|uniref:Aldehyde dehydrogenase (NAD+) n=1 Tax=Pusillimonas noertemannii TaxID=305977 RepID=A0A2U1CQU7_9BURK|nr:aldehyde dehydrogenase family protein [Pusillimonas noertemannii]NYT67600.1 aldehyde dehydrogenase family protein [Pusillimonas noertemannii]PVY68272.1 aldehyde dehydrogenase (NAD+) [Pusillimonas noertemannii]TFL12234.1 aldehyde dehydrogenase family protein [Pusillimonas noertemannii]